MFIFPVHSSEKYIFLNFHTGLSVSAENTSAYISIHQHPLHISAYISYSSHMMKASMVIASGDYPPF